MDKREAVAKLSELSKEILEKIEEARKIAKENDIEFSLTNNDEENELKNFSANEDDWHNSGCIEDGFDDWNSSDEC